MKEYIISSSDLSVSVITYGAALRNISFCGEPVAVGFDTEEEYKNDTCCFGTVVGRTANRCAEKNFIDGQEFCLSLNENGITHLHGGFVGFGKKEWTVTSLTQSSVSLSLFSPDGEEGYPGDLTCSVTYTVEGSKLLIKYGAVCTKDTWVCLTNHTYFSLNGGKKVFDLLVSVDADEVSVYDGAMRTCGRTSAKGELDLRKKQRITRELDHNYFLNHSKKSIFDGRELGLAAELFGDVGVNVWTDMPCVQIYTGNFIPEGLRVSGGRRIGAHSAICVETQYEPGFQTRGENILRKGKKFDSMTVFEFEKNV